MNTEEKLSIKKQKFILNTKLLKIGDVICTRDDTPISKLIRTSLPSEYSHVLLYVSDSSCIHADGDGVHSFNTQRLLLDNEDDFRVLRPKEITQDAVNKVVEYARLKIGTEYSKIDAGKSGIARKRKSKLKIDSRYQFCSRLVSEAFDAGGSKFFQTPSLCTPADVLESDFFEVVVDVVRIAEPEEIQFALDVTKNSIAKQTKITNRILSDVRALCSTKNIQTIEDLIKLVVFHPEYDQKVSSIIQMSGYLTMWADDVVKNPGRYFRTNYPTDAVIDLLTIDWVGYELNLAKDDFHRYEKNRLDFRKIYESRRLDTIYQFINLYQTLVSLSLQRIELFEWLHEKKSSM